MRHLVIGDIHGNLVALKQVLDKCNYDPSNDVLYFLGDYVDGWPNSKQVIDYLMKLSEKGLCIFIKGNHDDWWEAWVYNPVLQPHIWTSQGGNSTLESYGGQFPPDSHKQFCKEMKPYHIDEKDNVFVHGGFPTARVEELELGYPSRGTLWWDRTMANRVWMNRTMDVKKKWHNHKGLVFIGHSQTTAFDRKWTTPINKGGIVMLDTGAGYLDGCLTVMNVDEPEEYWQSNINTIEWPYKGHWGR